MSKTKSVRKLQLMLHETCTTEAARDEAKRVAKEEGMHLSGEGQVSLSARISDEAFRKLFVAAADDATLRVPDRLKPFVASISEAPEHLSFKPAEGQDP